MKVITVTNRKGGTGKSTTAVNIAAELSLRDKSVLLIDLDTQGHSTIGLGFEYKKGMPSIHSLFIDPFSDIDRVIYKTQWERIYLSPADPMFEHSKAGENRFVLRDAFNKSEIKNLFDFVIIDTAPSLDNLLINALVVSNFVLIPYQPHFLSIEGIKSLSRVFFRIASSENPSLRLLGLVPLMVNQRVHHHQRVTENLALNFGSNRILPGIRNDIKIVEAFEKRMPLIFYAPSSRARADFRELVDEILKRIGT